MWQFASKIKYKCHGIEGIACNLVYVTLNLDLVEKSKSITIWITKYCRRIVILLTYFRLPLTLCFSLINGYYTRPINLQSNMACPNFWNPYSDLLKVFLLLFSVFHRIMCVTNGLVCWETHNDTNENRYMELIYMYFGPPSRVGWYTSWRTSDNISKKLWGCPTRLTVP